MTRRLAAGRLRPWLTAGLVAAALLAAAGLGWRALRGQEDAAWDRIQAEGRWLVATDASYPPFAAVDADGNLFGFDIDLAEEIGRRWGVMVAFENITYDALLGTLIVRRDDAVISAFVPQPERTREVAYTRSYFVGGTVAVIRADAGQPLANDAQAWAAGKTLAVEYGAGGDALARQWARRVAGVKVTPKATAADALLAVEKGEADAAIVDALTAYDFLLSHPALALAGPLIEPEPYVIAVSIESPLLLEHLEAALAALEADGTLARLKVKWFGRAAIAES
ncbi:MAG: amino acid ABC transporter substrate-binding protein [Anaerolineales bacterium]|nr:amino acid ABC transporter substrate-binding protein [Anaerolineales bacterium]